MDHLINTTPTTISAEAVSGDSDILTEILRRLSAKPLGQFKSVSKRWFSLISDHRFSLLHGSCNKPTTSALVLCSSDQQQKQALVSFDNFGLGAQHFEFLFQPGTVILDSCNGFICYSKLNDGNDRPILEYYVCNATTRKSVKIPLMGSVFFSRRHRGSYKVIHKLYRVNFEDFKPENEPPIHILGVNLAFNPQNSPHYRVICVLESNSLPFDYQINVVIYKSETRSWGETLGPFKIPYGTSFFPGIFWNNHLHWIGTSHMIYFNIELEEHFVVSLPLTSNESNPIYFGDSRDHLYLVINENSSHKVLFVYEIEKDYSMWVLKFCLHIEPILDLILEIDPTHKPHSHAYSFVYLERGENEDGTNVLLGINGKLLFYSLEKKTIKTFGELPPFHFRHRWGWVPFDRYKMFPFHETILEV